MRQQNASRSLSITVIHRTSERLLAARDNDRANVLVGVERMRSAIDLLDQRTAERVQGLTTNTAALSSARGPKSTRTRTICSPWDGAT